jgi:hypothetical protein
VLGGATVLQKLSKSLTGDNPISRGMSEIALFDDIYFLATLANI